jgi:hypothetical protein
MSTGGGYNGRNHPGLDVLGLADKRQWFRCSPVVELVMSEAVNVRRLIRTDSRQLSRVFTGEVGLVLAGRRSPLASIGELLNALMNLLST